MDYARQCGLEGPAVALAHMEQSEVLLIRAVLQEKIRPERFKQEDSAQGE